MAMYVNMFVDNAFIKHISGMHHQFQDQNSCSSYNRVCLFMKLAFVIASRITYVEERVSFQRIMQVLGGVVIGIWIHVIM